MSTETKSGPSFVWPVTILLCVLLLAGFGSFTVYQIAKMRVPVVPVTPDNPIPIPSTNWDTLIPDEALRNTVGNYYLALADAVEVSNLSTVGQFREAHQNASKVLQESGKLPSLANVNGPISDRIAQVVGLDDGPLNKPALVGVLRQIGSEMGGEK